MFIPSGSVIYPLYRRGAAVTGCHHEEFVENEAVLTEQG